MDKFTVVLMNTQPFAPVSTAWNLLWVGEFFSFRLVTSLLSSSSMSSLLSFPFSLVISFPYTKKDKIHFKKTQDLYKYYKIHPYDLNFFETLHATKFIKQLSIVIQNTINSMTIIICRPNFSYNFWFYKYKKYMGSLNITLIMQHCHNYVCHI